MTQGIFIEGKRPSSKKQVREAIEAGKRVRAEATSVFGNEYDGLISEMPKNTVITFVGPNPHNDRRFYGTIKWNTKQLAWQVS